MNLGTHMLGEDRMKLKNIKDKVEKIGERTWEDMEKAELAQTVCALVDSVSELESEIQTLEDMIYQMQDRVYKERE